MTVSISLVSEAVDREPFLFDVNYYSNIRKTFHVYRPPGPFVRSGAISQKSKLWLIIILRVQDFFGCSSNFRSVNIRKAISGWASLAAFDTAIFIFVLIRAFDNCKLVGKRHLHFNLSIFSQ